MKEIEKNWFKLCSKFEALTYSKRCIVIAFSIFVIFPILCITKLIFLCIAIGFGILAMQIFQMGKKENDMSYLIGVICLGVFGLCSFAIWIMIY